VAPGDLGDHGFDERQVRFQKSCRINDLDSFFPHQAFPL
jgi:hypothetical protein